MNEGQAAKLQAVVDELRDAADNLAAVLSELTQAVLLRQGADAPMPAYPPPGGTWAPTVTWDWSAAAPLRSTSNRPAASSWDWSGAAPLGGTRAA